MSNHLRRSTAPEVTGIHRSLAPATGKPLPAWWAQLVSDARDLPPPTGNCCSGRGHGLRQRASAGFRQSKKRPLSDFVERTLRNPNRRPA